MPAFFGCLFRASTIFFGIFFVVAMPIGLFWNETRVINTARSLMDGARLVTAGSTRRTRGGSCTSVAT